jgi:hypothetical protein
MAVPVSSLSVAVQGIADFLDSQFGEDVVISVDSPQRAAERVKGGDKHFLNLFAYRVVPSGFHSASTSEEPLFVRINVLLTPFLTDQDGGIRDSDLRILGHAIRVLASHPVVPAGPLPGSNSDPEDFRSGPHLDYRLEAFLQAPSMEELNHIWTTQGGELAYRLSAAYEFSLIPVEPLEHRVPAGPVRSSILDLRPSVPDRPSGLLPFGAEARAVPLAADSPDLKPPPTDLLPLALFAPDTGLSNRMTVAPGTASINLAISGLPGSHAAVSVAWTRADSSVETQVSQGFPIGAVRIDDPAAVVALKLSSPKEGDSAVISTRAASSVGTAIPESPATNTLTLTVAAP